MGRGPVLLLALALAACTAPAPPDETTIAVEAHDTWVMAEAGDPIAQTVLGTMFETGAFGEPDFRAAALWYDRAVRQGDPLAAFYLASLFERGLGVDQDWISAANLYARSARAGNAAAAFKLGFLHEKGLGVPRDFVAAGRWYEAARQGWTMQGLEPMTPTYLTADASPEEVQVLIDRARQSQTGTLAPMPEPAAPVPAAPEPQPEAPAVLVAEAPEPEAVEPEAVEVPAVVAAAPEALGTGFHVHLASERSVEAAMADWQDLRLRFPDLLEGLNPALATLDLGSAGTYYQLLAGPIPGEADADVLCARLQPEGQYCMPVLPQG